MNTGSQVITGDKFSCMAAMQGAYHVLYLILMNAAAYSKRKTSQPLQGLQESSLVRHAFHASMLSTVIHCFTILFIGLLYVRKLRFFILEEYRLQRHLWE